MPMVGSQPTCDVTSDSASARFFHFVETGDAKILEALLAEHVDRAYSQARRLLGSMSEAEDAVQEAFIRLVRTANRYEVKVPFAAWLGRLVHHSAVDALRRRSRRREMERNSGEPKAQPSSRELLEGNDIELVRSVVRELPEQYRATVDLHYFAGLSQRDTASALGIKENAVAKRLERAREYLRNILQSRGISATGAAVAIALGSPRIEAAPDALLAKIPSVTSVAASGTGGLATLAGVVSMKSVLIALAALALAGVGTWSMNRERAAKLTLSEKTGQAGSFSRVWDFETPALPEEMAIFWGKLEWKAGLGPDGSGCLETTADYCGVGINVPEPGPYVISCDIQALSPDNTGIEQFVIGMRQFTSGSFINLFAIPASPTNQWIHYQAYVAEDRLDVWQQGRRSALAWLRDGRGPLQMGVNGHYRIDRMTVRRITRAELPADVDDVLAATADAKRYEPIGFRVIPIPDITGLNPNQP
jgi:RNA polymerase sigma factor (sigma-70 family)